MPSIRQGDLPTGQAYCPHSDDAAMVFTGTVANINTALEGMTFDPTPRGFFTIMGTDVASSAVGLAEAGANAIGSNCGNGIERMIDIVKAMRAATLDTPILVHANAGLPKNIDGVDTFPETPEDMARQVGGLVGAGANIIGGCCGTTPAHIQAMKEAVS